MPSRRQNLKVMNSLTDDLLSAVILARKLINVINHQPSQAIPTLLPIGIVQVKGNFLVHLIDPSRLDFTPSFFRQSIPDVRPVDKILHLKEWLLENKVYGSEDNFENTCGIFHVSRCGSTLLAENLKATGQFVVLSEASLLGKSLKHDALSDQVFTTSVALWQNWARYQNKKLLIKFSSRNHYHAKLVMNVLDRARFVFLYREPVGVLESLTRKPPYFIKRAIDLIDETTIPELECHTKRGPAFMATKTYCIVLDTFLKISHHNLIAVNYEDLRSRYPDILAHFKLNFSDNQALWDDRMNAKWTGKVQPIYIPIKPGTLREYASKEAKFISIARLYFNRYQKYCDKHMAKI